VLGAICLLPCLKLQAQDQLPVYVVTQSGATPNQASNLAGFFNLPASTVLVTNGQVFFTDPTNFMAIPMLPVTDATITNELLAQTTNKFPSIPISFQQLDFNTLSNLTVPGSNAAVSMAAAALSAAGLTPASASPDVTHTSVSAIYTNDDGSVTTVSNAIDTEVDYQFTVPAGYPLMGPGAQAQFTFGPNGQATRLLYAARQLAPGPMVNLISASQAGQRAAALYPGLNAQINTQLVYYAPPLSIGTVTFIIPWYQCGGTANVTNPLTQQVSTSTLMPALIPATDDPAYVPAVTLSASAVNGDTQISAGAGVTGGMPPYTYQWSGAASGLGTNDAAEITFTPTVRLTRPNLTIAPARPGFVISWFDPSGFFVLESSSNLPSGIWNAVTNQVVAGGNDLMQTSVAGNSSPTFYRLGLPGPTLPMPEPVGLRVIDGNGIYIHTNQSLPVIAVTPYPIQVQVAPLLFIGWGTESPFDPGLGTVDEEDWTFAMIKRPVTGTERFFNIYWASESWDYIAPIDNSNGIANYEINTADIVLHIGHGDPDGFQFTSGFCPDRLQWGQSIRGWGNPSLTWLGLLSCNVLESNDSSNVNINQRWGQNFGGLHLLLGFTTEAYAETGFPTSFVSQMIDYAEPVMTSWFWAAHACNTGKTACLSVLGPNKVTELGDHWWGEGSVGPNITPFYIRGWVYVMTQ
jgi:hypothetical protein